MDPMSMMSRKETELSSRRIGLGIFLTVPETNGKLTSTAAGWIPCSKQKISQSPSDSSETLAVMSSAAAYVSSTISGVFLL